MVKNNGKNKKGTIVFSLLLISIALSICNSGLFLYTNIYYYIPHFIKIPTLLLPLFGPLFYIYLRLLTQDNFQFNRYSLLHFLPFAIFISIYSTFLIQNGDYKINYINNWLNNTISRTDRIKDLTIFPFIIIHIFSYLIYSLRYLTKFENNLKNIYTNEITNYSWIKKFIYLFIFTFIAITILYLILVLSGINFKQAYRALPIFVVASLCYLAYHAAIQSNMHIGLNLEEIKKSTETSAPLQQSEINDIAKKLITAMETEKVFLEMELTLPGLADKLGITRNQLSFVLNNHFKENFYDFINRYRIEEVKNILAQPSGKNFNLLNIGLNVGFSSKTAFNVNFKKRTKMSPSQYKKYQKTTNV